MKAIRYYYHGAYLYTAYTIANTGQLFDYYEDEICQMDEDDYLRPQIVDHLLKKYNISINITAIKRAKNKWRPEKQVKKLTLKERAKFFEERRVEICQLRSNGNIFGDIIDYLWDKYKFLI